MAQKVKEVAEENPRYGKKQMVSILNFASGSVLTILHEILNMNMVSCHWVPKMFSRKSKRERGRW